MKNELEIINEVFGKDIYGDLDTQCILTPRQVIECMKRFSDQFPRSTGLNKEDIIKWIDAEIKLNKESGFSDNEQMEELNIEMGQLEKFKKFILSLPSPPPAQREEGEEAKRFLDWVDNSGYCSVYSQELKTGAWVDSNEHPIYTHGSDFHLTNLVKNHGITTSELYTKFKSQP